MAQRPSQPVICPVLVGRGEHLHVLAMQLNGKKEEPSMFDGVTPNAR